MTETTVRKLARAAGEHIAYLRREGKTPGVVWLGGFHSDMAGTKAEALDAWAARPPRVERPSRAERPPPRRGRAYVRFDYFGHGLSSGAFRDGTISRWRDDALAVLDELCTGPQVLVGSSMGGWIALLVALARPEKVAGLLLIAPASDFTETLVWQQMTPDVQLEIMEKGEWQRPSLYDEESYPITRTLIEDGRKHLVLRGAMIRLCAAAEIAPHPGHFPCIVRIVLDLVETGIVGRVRVEGIAARRGRRGRHGRRSSRGAGEACKRRCAGQQSKRAWVKRLVAHSRQ